MTTTQTVTKESIDATPATAAPTSVVVQYAAADDEYCAVCGNPLQLVVANDGGERFVGRIGHSGAVCGGCCSAITQDKE